MKFLVPLVPLLFIAYPAEVRSAEAPVSMMNCPGRGHSSDSVYNDLKAINIYVDAPLDYRDKYKIYPQALYPETIASLLQARIKDNYKFLLPLDEKCKVIEPIIVDLSKPENVAKIDAIKGAVTVTVKIDIIVDATPPTAILTRTVYRPDERYYKYYNSSAFTTAIPLNLPPIKLDEKLAAFVMAASAAPILMEESVP